MARAHIESSAVAVVLSLVILIFMARKKSAATLIATISFGLLLGLWRGTSYMVELARYNDLYRQKVTIIGTADTDAIYDNSQLSFDLVNLQIINPESTPLVGKIGIKGFGVPMVYKGERLQVEGRLYKTRGSRQAGISYAQIKVINHHTSIIDTVRRRFQAGMQSALPEPLASFGLGLLIGQRNTLPEIVTLQLAAVGLTHIVAVSGYNLTIIVRAMRRLLKNQSKYQLTLFSFLLIGLFLLFTGFSPSIVRAAVVSGLSLIAWYYGRSIRPLLIILLAAVLTSGWYPLYLWSDIGWYLSFLAFFGVLILAPTVLKRLYRKKRQPHPLTLILYETLAAQLMTLPLIMFIFGEVSLISIVANLLVVPMVPLAMLTSLVAGMAGMLIPAFAGWFAWPARLVLTYMLDVVHLLSKVPHALVSKSLALEQMVTLYGLIVTFCLALWHKTKHKAGIITDNDGIQT